MGVPFYMLDKQCLFSYNTFKTLKGVIAIMEIKQLQIFLAVADQLSFSNAAKVLYVTQSLVSQQIADLESQLNVLLFKRSRRSVQLTPAGNTLYKEAKEILAHIDSATLLTQQAAQGIGLQGTLRIGVEQVFSREKLTPAIFTFRSEHPMVECSIQTYSYHQMLKAFGRGDIDVGFTCVEHINDDSNSNLTLHIIHRDQLVFAAAKQAVSVSNLQSYLNLTERLPLCLLENDNRGLKSIIKVCEDLGIAPQYRFFSSVDDILLNTEIGTGLTLLPNSIINYYHNEHLAYFPVKTVSAQLYTAACWPKTSNNPFIIQFLEDHF